MYKILFLVLILGVGLSWAGLPDEEQQDEPGWIPKSDSDGNVVWHNPANEDELEPVSFVSVTSLTHINCTHEYDCAVVATIPGSAKCTNNICRCNVESGFVGLALSWNKCICPPPKIISWSGGAPICTFNFMQRYISGWAYPTSSSSYSSHSSSSSSYSLTDSLSRTRSM